MGPMEPVDPGLEEQLLKLQERPASTLCIDQDSPDDLSKLQNPDALNLANYKCTYVMAARRFDSSKNVRSNGFFYLSVLCSSNSLWETQLEVIKKYVSLARTEATLIKTEADAQRSSHWFTNLLDIVSTGRLCLRFSLRMLRTISTISRHPKVSHGRWGGWETSRTGIFELLCRRGIQYQYQ